MLSEQAPQPNTFLLGEGGSTKTDWRWITPEEVLPLTPTAGYNLHVSPAAAVRADLSAALLPQLPAREAPATVCYYGPALRSPALREQMAAVFRDVFGPQPAIRIHHDLEAAVRSCPASGRLAAGILGTGSNAALVEDGRLLMERGGEGYLIGDLGSAADLGRRLLRGLLNDALPAELADAFRQQCGQSPLACRDELMHRPQPNLALASLAPLLGPFRDEAAVASLLRHAFLAYLRETIGTFPEVKRAYLIGSVAAAYEPLLAGLLAEQGYHLAGVYPRPIERLALLHQRELNTPRP